MSIICVCPPFLFVLLLVVAFDAKVWFGYAAEIGEILKLNHDCGYLCNYVVIGFV